MASPLADHAVDLGEDEVPPDEDGLDLVVREVAPDGRPDGREVEGPDPLDDGPGQLAHELRPSRGLGEEESR